MANQAIYLTPKGRKKLEQELEHLRNVKRQEVAKRLHEAMEDGELIENAEYEAAKNEQAFVEGRILTIENMIKNAVIIAAAGSSPGEVKLGSKVTVLSPEGEREYYVIVGRAEADPSQGKISNESPVGHSLLGKRVGDEVEVHAPAGPRKLVVVAIE